MGDKDTKGQETLKRNGVLEVGTSDWLKAHVGKLEQRVIQAVASARESAEAEDYSTATMFMHHSHIFRLIANEIKEELGL